MGPERGTDREEGNALKGEAHGRSSALDALGGLVVDVAQGVIKPRTRHAMAEGSAIGKRSHQAGMCRRAEEVQERKRRRDAGQPARDGAGSR